MQASSYLTHLNLPDASTPFYNEDEDEEDNYDGYGEYVYNVADKLRVANAQLCADTTPVESGRPRRVQFCEDPVEQVVCFTPEPVNIYYSEDDFICEGAHEEATGAMSVVDQNRVAASDHVTSGQDTTTDGASSNCAATPDDRNSIVECAISERLEDETDNTVKNTEALCFANGTYPLVEEQGSNSIIGSDTDSVEEDIPCHGSQASQSKESNSYDIDVDEEEISTSQATLSSAESDTASITKLQQRKGQTELSTSRPFARLVSSADGTIRPKPTVKSKQCRPHTSTGIRPLNDVQRGKQAKLPKYGGNQRSVYGLPNEVKEMLQRKKLEKEIQNKKKAAKLQKDEEERKKEAQLAFQAWLAKKKCTKNSLKGEVEETLQTNHETGQDVIKEDSQGAFKVWLERKRLQKRQEEMTRKMKDLELARVTTKVTREDAERAYLSWLKKKEKEEREKKASCPMQPTLQRYDALSPRSLRALELYLQSEEFLRYPEIVL